MSNVTPLIPAATRVADAALIGAAKDRVAISVANELMMQGYRVTSIQTETRAFPVIWLAADARLAALVAHDFACYYKHGCDDTGPYRVGQYRKDGANVQWIERPGVATWWRH